MAGYGQNYDYGTSPKYKDEDASPATIKCVRSLLKFDDMLIMLNSLALNNGIMGFRSGQELKSTSDFIEFQ
jgi:hypothetical protein